MIRTDLASLDLEDRRPGHYAPALRLEEVTQSENARRRDEALGRRVPGAPTRAEVRAARARGARP